MRKTIKETLGNHNFYYSHRFECEYENYYECQNGSDCCKDDYCRCGTIENTKVTSVGDILDYFGDLSEFDKYCVDRILCVNKVWDKNYWEVRVQGGYYGQEVDGIYWERGDSVESLVKLCLDLKTNKEKIEYILKLEYGHILDLVKNKRWLIKEVSKDLIRFGQKDHYQKLDREAIERYKDYSLPRGICLESHDHYQIIDGYHRLAATDDEKVKIICASKG